MLLLCSRVTSIEAAASRSLAPGLTFGEFCSGASPTSGDRDLTIYLLASYSPKRNTCRQ